MSRLSSRAACPDAGRPLRAARVAVATVFFVNGAVFSNWVPRIPEIKGGLGLSDVALGTALLGAGLGALAGSLGAGPLVARFGSRVVALTSGVALCASLPLPALARSWAALAGGLAVFGALDAVVDVAMNAHGVVVERRYRRPILGGFHALWSVGAAVGALAGAAAAAAGLTPAAHFRLAGAVLAVPVLVAGRWLLSAEADRDRGAGRAAIVLPTRAVGVLGLLALLAALVEGAPGDWSAVYLAEDLGVAPGVAGAGYVVFAAAMLLGRFAGDAVVVRWGPVRTVRWGTLLAAAGMAGGLLLGSVAAVVAGFGLVGLGVCMLFPVAFSAAGHLPGLPSGAAISMVSLVARAGFLAGPPLVGALAELAGLGTALGVVVLAALAIAVLARGVAPASEHV